VVGFSDPRVFDSSGIPVTKIALGAGTIACIEATAGEDRVIIVDPNRAIYWIDPATWSVLDRWPGPWMHGDRFRPAGQIAVDDKAVAVGLNPGETATVGGGEVRRASLKID
jgi:hypothetical protein